MKITFDHQVFTFQPYGGISRYFVRLAEGLLGLGEDVRVVAPVHCNRYVKELPEKIVKGVSYDRFPLRFAPWLGAANRQIASLWVSQNQPDLLHETYYAPRSLRGRFKGRIVTVYDMIHEKFADDFSALDPTSRHKRIAVSRADHIICISHSTRNDLCELFDIPADKVSVVHLGFEKFIGLDGPISVNTSLVRPYFLYVGYRSAYKNFSGMLKAVASSAMLRDTFDIIAFGGSPFTPDEQRLINALGFKRDAVRQMGGDDRVLGQLYNGAAAFVYPSLYEGFGLPPLEAMAHDCPVITSNTSSMPEVVGSAGEYFDPSDTDSMIDAIKRVVFDTNRRDELISEGKLRLDEFSWSRCAAETRDIYHSLLRPKGAA